MLLIVVGMAAACVAFWWDWHNREYIHAVPVRYDPEAAAAAEAAIREQAEAAMRAAPGATTPAATAPAPDGPARTP